MRGLPATAVVVCLAACSDPPPPPPAAPAASMRAWTAATAADREAAGRAIAAEHPGFQFERVEKFTCAGQTHDVAVFLHTQSKLEFVLVPGGSALVGLLGNPEPGLAPDKRRRRIDVPSVLIGRTETTRGAYRAVMDTDPSAAAAKDDTLPVENVTFEMAQQFCRKLGMDIPFHAEWEQAARGGVIDDYAFGWDVAGASEWGWWLPESRGQPHPVGTKRPNAFGLFDVHGNVAEWCRRDPSDEPAGDAKGWKPQMRGGAFDDKAPARVWDFDLGEADFFAKPRTGFRAVLRLEAPKGVR